MSKMAPPPHADTRASDNVKNGTSAARGSYQHELQGNSTAGESWDRWVENPKSEIRNPKFPRRGRP